VAEPVRPRVVLASNGTFNILAFRTGLIRALQAAGYEPIVVAPRDSGTEARMAELGVRQIEVRLSRKGLNPLADLALVLSYRRLLRRLRPLALLGFTIKPNIYGALAAKGLNVPALPNVSGLGTVFIRGGILQALVVGLYRRAFRRLRTVFFQNPDDRALFVEHGIVRPGQARLIPGSGIDLQQFQPAPLPRQPVFLLIARLLGDKGVREYAEAARLLGKALPEARFQLLGPFDEQNATAIGRRELDEWLEQGIVEYLGPTEDVRPFIAAASVVVLPSYREGMPRSLLEGAAMGRPLVATDVPGCREIVEEGRTGYLCAARDAASLADAMRRMAMLPHEAREEMGRAAREKVQDEFSEELVIRAYLDELEQLRRERS
jgi:glycosyltransferase involved in cell wall biosynthesis